LRKPVINSDLSTVKAFIRFPKNPGNEVFVRFRLCDGRNVQLFYKSEIMVDPDMWDPKKEQYKAKISVGPKERALFNKTISETKSVLRDVYSETKDKITNSKDFWEMVDRKLNPEKYRLSFFDLFDLFLKKHKLSQVRVNNYLVVKRALMRYELFRQKRDSRTYKLEINTVTADTLMDVEDFWENEHLYFDKNPELYILVPESRPPKPRGRNTINLMFGRMKTFYLWTITNDHTLNNPFKKFNVGECVYGTPYYITLEERDKIFCADLKDYPLLAISRDIFVFQCLIGCRVGDLWSMTTSNVINGGIEYIARKTREGRPVTIRVPLNNRAKEILSRYPVTGNRPLFPFPTQQTYNYDIKEIFRLSGITRIVTVLNPTTSEPEQRPINEIASSHLARRTFIGNLYKRVKDPNLVGALSGHKEGSKAFARYRDIDEEMKTELVNMLE